MAIPEVEDGTSPLEFHLDATTGRPQMILEHEIETPAGSRSAIRLILDDPSPEAVERAMAMIERDALQ